MGHVICISSQKGGVGRTTTSVNLSTAFAVAEKSCLLVDFDPQGHATLGLGGIHSGGKGTIYQALIGKAATHEVVVPTSLEFLHILPSNLDLLQAEAELPRMVAKENRLKDLLSNLKEHYDFILIDTPPGLGLMTVNGLVAADSLLIPLQCGFYAFAGLSPYLRFAAMVKKHLNPVLQLEGILLNMVFAQQTLSSRIADQAKACLSDWIFETVIPWDEAVSQAALRGRPLLLQDMRAACSLRYLDLAKELISRGERSGARGDVDFSSLAKSAKGGNWMETSICEHSQESLQAQREERGMPQ